GPEPLGVAFEVVEPFERFAGQRVLVVDVLGAHLGERSRVLPTPGGLPAVDQLIDVHACALGKSNAASPSPGVEASAERRRGMRPAPRASRPAWTDSLIAVAIATGS